MSLRSTDLSTEEGVRAALNEALVKKNLNITELEDLFQKVKTHSPAEPASTFNDYVTRVHDDLKSKKSIMPISKQAKKRSLLQTVVYALFN